MQGNDAFPFPARLLLGRFPSKHKEGTYHMKHSIRAAFVLASLLMTMLIAGVVQGQTSTGTLTGLVVDSTGAVVPGVTVRVVNTATNDERTVVTNNEGLYVVPSLPPGQYRLAVEKAGFSKTEVSAVTVNTAQVTTTNLTLQIGRATETVTVTADADLLTKDSAAVTATVENKLLLEMPFPERSALGAIMLSPGVQGDPQYPGGIQSENPGPFTQPVATGATISINGARNGASSILVDGSDISLASYPRTGVTFSGDTVNQMTVQTLGIPAQYGRTAGGVINQATKTGTNQFHGGLFWQHTDPGLQAWRHGSHQAGVPPQFHQNLFSGIFSGPVWLPRSIFGPASIDGRNRTFFHVTVEPARITDELWSFRTRIPTAKELTGDLSEGYDVLSQCCLATLQNQGVEAALAQLRGLQAQGRAPQLFYQFDRNAQGIPFGNRYNSPTQYVAIPGNNLSAVLRNNPLAQYIFSLYPSTTRPTQYARFIRPDGLWAPDGNNIFQARGVRNRDNRYSMRFDHALTANDRLAFRYTYVPVAGTRWNFFGPDINANPIPLDRSLARNFYLSHTRNFGANKVNEFRATYMRGNQFRYPADAVVEKDWGAELGLRAATLGFGFPTLSGLPGGNIGLGGGTGNGGGRTLDVNLGLSDDFSWIVGRHALKMGVDFRFYQMNRYDTTDLLGGTYGFSAAQTNSGAGGGSALASFILGVVNSYTVKTTEVPFYYRWRYYSGYAQDDFKVRQNLTINAGLRYAIETPRTEKYNRQGSFDPNVTGTLNGLPVKGGFVFSGENGRPRGLWEVNRNGFEPRLGIAWTPKDFMTVRASYAFLKAPLTGQSFFIIPDLNAPSIPISGNNGGVNVGQVNYITNPVGPIGPNLALSSGPLFNFAGIYIDPSNKRPYSQQWSLSLQFQVSRSMAIDLTYSGSKGTHLFVASSDLNRPADEAVIAGIRSRTNFTAAQANKFNLTDASGRIRTMTYFESLRPYGQFFDRTILTYLDRRGNSQYHALYVTAKQRLAKGLVAQASYTWSKSIDDASASFGGAIGQESDIFGLARPQVFSDLRAEKALSTYDIPHRLTVGWTWDLPLGKKGWVQTKNAVVNTLFGGWTLAGLATAQGGYPIWVRMGNTGYWFSQGGGDALLQTSTLRPNLVPGVPLINPDWRKDPYRSQFAGGYLNPAAFAVPGSLDNPAFGNAPRTLSGARNPNTYFFDANLSKRFPLKGEKLWLQLRADFINALNHPNFFFNPNNGHDVLTGNFNRNSLTNPAIAPFSVNGSFGRLDPNNTNNGRTIRVAIRLGF